MCGRCWFREIFRAIIICLYKFFFFSFYRIIFNFRHLVSHIFGRSGSKYSVPCIECHVEISVPVCVIKYYNNNFLRFRYVRASFFHSFLLGCFLVLLYYVIVASGRQNYGAVAVAVAISLRRVRTLCMSECVLIKQQHKNKINEKRNFSSCYSSLIPHTLFSPSPSHSLRCSIYFVRSHPLSHVGS